MASSSFMHPQRDIQRRRMAEEEDRPVPEGVEPSEVAVVAGAPADENASVVDPPANILPSGKEDTSPAECSTALDCNSCHKLHIAALEREQMEKGSEAISGSDSGCYWKASNDQDSTTTSGCLERFGLPPDMLKEVITDKTTCFFQTEPTTKVVNGEIEGDDLGGSIVGGAFILLFIACLFVLRHRILGLVQGKLMGDDSQHGVDDSDRSTTDVLAGLNFGSSHGPINVGSPSHQQFVRESVPLAAADMNNRSISIEDEEWGWEDSDPTDELEMAISASRKGSPSRSGPNAAQQRRQKEEDELQMALALSMSESAAPPVASPSGQSRVSLPPKSKPTQTSQQVQKSKITKATPPMHRQGSNQSNGSRGGIAPQPIETLSSTSSAPMTTADLLQAMPMAITSLGTKSSNNNIKKPTPKSKPNKDDELFASLGLASKPTFKPPGNGDGTAPSAPRSGGYTGPNSHAHTGNSNGVANGAGPSHSTLSSAPRSAPSRHIATTTTSSAAKAVMDEEDGLSAGLGDDWGDDDDLDDLLND